MICVLFSESEKKTSTTLASAMKLQKEMEANMGGTEMLKPFNVIYEKKTIKNYPRKVNFAVYMFYKIVNVCKH